MTAQVTIKNTGPYKVLIFIRYLNKALSEWNLNPAPVSLYPGDETTMYVYDGHDILIKEDDEDFIKGCNSNV